LHYRALSRIGSRLGKNLRVARGSVLLPFMPRTILHVDMDAFYAAVEQRDHPEFQHRPVIVGSDPKGGTGRGIVSTCSYEARRFGVHSAQPISQAWRLCPQGVYIQPDMRKYARVSGMIMDVLSCYTDMLEQISVDEAFLDVTGSRRLYGTGREIAGKIKDRICGELRLTASVGVAPNKFLAKIASDLRKPDGLVVVEPGKEKDFLAPLEIRRLWGVGPKTEATLGRIGLRTVGQVAAMSQRDLERLLGESGAQLWRLAQGIDERPVEAVEGCKSIGHETTFEKDTADFDLLHATLLELVEKTARRMRLEGVRGRTVTVKFREEDFSTFTRRVTLDDAVDTSEKIFPVALKLMKGLLREDVRVRLIGVSLSNLVTEGARSAAKVQLGLFDQPTQPMQPSQSAQSSPKERKLAAAIDDISRRFGDRAITRATLVPK
jgi:nucleotidyltransferase/DNA polymerase involved in DNA repair